MFDEDLSNGDTRYGFQEFCGDVNLIESYSTHARADLHDGISNSTSARQFGRPRTKILQTLDQPINQTAPHNLIPRNQPPPRTPSIGIVFTQGFISHFSPHKHQRKSPSSPAVGTTSATFRTVSSCASFRDRDRHYPAQCQNGRQPSKWQHYPYHQGPDVGV